MNEIGEILKDARIKKGYTLDDLQQTTKIQKRYLEAIEQGNADILPGRFYERAFVKQYADIVGLDGEELLDEYYQMTVEEEHEELAESISTSPSRTQGKEDSFLNNISEQLPTILIFLIVALILIGIYFAFRQTNAGDQSDTPIISEENTEEIVESEADETEEGSDEDTAEDATEDEEDTDEEEEEVETEEQKMNISNSTTNDTNYEVVGPHPEEQSILLTAEGGSSWVSIEIDGEVVETETLSAGTSVEASFGTDVQTINLRIGNANATEIFLNDAELQYGEESEGTVQNIIIDFVDSE